MDSAVSSSSPSAAESVQPMQLKGKEESDGELIPINPDSENSTSENSSVESEECKTIQFLYANIEAAQQKTGAYTMLDCRNILFAYKIILNFFKTITTESISEPIILNSFEIFLKAIEVQQAKGVFTMQGSVELLEKLEFIQKSLNAKKDPALKLKEMHEKIKGDVGKSAKKKKDSNNKKK